MTKKTLNQNNNNKKTTVGCSLFNLFTLQSQLCFTVLLIQYTSRCKTGQMLNTKLLSLWCATPILPIQYPQRAALLLHYVKQLSFNKRSTPINQNAGIPDGIHFELYYRWTETLHTKPKVTLHFKVSLCLLLVTYTKEMQAFSPKRSLANPQTMCQIICYPKLSEHWPPTRGINLFGTKPRFQINA